MNIKKAKQEALSYFESSLNVSYNDCSDSMHDMDKSLARFEAFTDDKYDISTFIEQHLLDECAKIYQEFYDENLKDSEWIECRDDLENPSVSDLVLPFKLLEPKLKLQERHLK